MPTAKTVRFHRTGGPEVLEFEDLPVLEPGPGEIRLRVEALGINYAECLYRRGHYIYPPKLPSQLGYEAVGTVNAVGPGVNEPKVGDRISTIPAFKMSDYGVYGEVAIVPAFAAAPCAENLSAAENASLWLQTVTAYGSLVHYGQIRAGDFVLVIPATGGVGVAAIQIAKATGAVAIATTRTAKKRQFLLDCGADHVIVTEEEDTVSRLTDITSARGVRLILNAFTGPLMETLVEVIAPGGTIFHYGGLGPAETPLPWRPLLRKGAKIQGYTLFELTYDPANLPAIRRYVLDGVRAGQFKPIIDRIFPFAQIADAQRYVESGSLSGRVVVTL